MITATSPGDISSGPVTGNFLLVRPAGVGEQPSGDGPHVARGGGRCPRIRVERPEVAASPCELAMISTWPPISAACFAAYRATTLTGASAAARSRTSWWPTWPVGAVTTITADARRGSACGAAGVRWRGRPHRRRRPRRDHRDLTQPLGAHAARQRSGRSMKPTSIRSQPAAFRHDSFAVLLPQAYHVSRPEAAYTSSGT